MPFSPIETSVIHSAVARYSGLPRTIGRKPLTTSRRCIVTGGSSPLGIRLAEALQKRGDRVLMIGRDAQRLADAAANRQPLVDDGNVHRLVADLSLPGEAQRIVDHADQLWGGIDVVVNIVGRSDRGLVEELTDEHMMHLFDANVLTALRMCRAAAAPLKESRGVVVNVGSLGGKVGARYLGGYAMAKHSLTALTQQLRLEWRPAGVHVGLVSPGPIRRDDAGRRYDAQVDRSDIPATAAKPGGGTRVRGLSPDRVVAGILRVMDHRSPDIILPGYLRWLVAIGHLSPRLGDWILLKMT